MTSTRPSRGVPSIGEVVGTNCQRLRFEACLTQDEFVQRLRMLGLSWKRSNLSALEGGDRPRTSLSELVLVAVAFGRPLDELLAGPGQVQLGGHVPQVLLDDLRRFVAGGTAPTQLDALLVNARGGARDEVPLAERDMARRLDVPTSWVLEAAQALWGHTLTEERDMRVEAMVDTDHENRRTRRASITKQLEVSVRKRVERRELGYEYE